MVSLSSSLLLFLLLIFFSSSNSLPDSPTQPSNGTTVYELLQKCGLPSGLLPDSVTSFSLSDSGDFVVELQKPCYLQFEYLVYYDRRITGTLMYGGIKNLKGIEVKRFFLWLNVDEIMVDLPPSDFIYFHVGWITKKLDISQFRRVRSCRDGVCMSVLQVPEGNSMSILQLLHSPSGCGSRWFLVASFLPYWITENLTTQTLHFMCQHKQGKCQCYLQSR